MPDATITGCPTRRIITNTFDALPEVIPGETVTQDEYYRYGGLPVRHTTERPIAADYPDDEMPPSVTVLAQWLLRNQ